MKPPYYLPLAALLALCAPLNGQDALTADTIVAKAEQAAYYAGKDGRADVTMTISDAKGGTRSREFVILRLNTGERAQKFYVYFKEPADVRRMAYLVWKQGADRPDDRWLWLPALNLNKRIAPGDKRTSFVGSDFLYEDVSGRSLAEDTHELLREEEGRYVIKNTPTSPEAVEFAYYHVWIDKISFLPVKGEYYDANDKAIRRVESTKVETIQGYPTVMEAVASDLRSGSSTRNVFSNVKYDLGLKEQIFTERFLRRPPLEVR